MSNQNSAINIKLGARARARIEREGLKPSDITCIPAAAGGPKGLALIPLDRWLFGEWFARAGHNPTLIGASVGAWRLAAAAQTDPVAALEELSRTYIEDQVYAEHPTPAQVSQLIRLLARSPLTRAAGSGWAPRAGVSLRVVTARAAGALHQQVSRTAFAKAALDNFVARQRLAKHLRRVIFAAGPPSSVDVMLGGTGTGFDAFGAERHDLTSTNAEQALLASGSIPLLCDPVKVGDPANDMPPGWYWDGGLIDYHLYYPYAQLEGLVLYPHFSDTIVPGWLDKFVPWRKQGRVGRDGRGGNEWLSNVILISPSRTFLRTLPNQALPSRQDFHRYGLDHARRILDWKRAVSECGRFADAAAAWLEAPDLSMAEPL